MTFNETIAEYRMGAMGIRDQVLRAQVVSSDGSVLGEAYAPVKRSMVAEDGSTDWYKLQPVASSGNQVLHWSISLDDCVSLLLAEVNPLGAEVLGQDS